MRKDRLGRGLGALLGDYLESDGKEAEVRRLPVGSIVANPHQPRQEFSELELSELVASIRENGLLQPLLVRPDPDRPDRYQLVAGERRFRSIQRLDWTDVPVVIREVTDEALLVLALVENIQREQLGPLEEAEGYQSLIDRFDMTQEEVAHAVGKERSTVANMLRLLRLPPSIRKLLQANQLSMGHARALLGVGDPVRAGDLAREAVAEGWSVREVERRARAARGEGPAPAGRRERRSADPLVRALEEALRERLATRVQIRGGGQGKGVIEVPFHDAEDFERLFALITGSEASDVLG